MFPVMERMDVTEVSLAIGPAIAQPLPSPEAEVNWQFQNDDGYQLVLAPSAATLSVGKEYRDIAQLTELFAHVLDALANAHSAPPRCDRLGVRYLNSVECPPGPDATWRSWFREELMGWTTSGILTSGVEVASILTQTQLAGPSIAGRPDVNAIIHHGLLPAATRIPGVPAIQHDSPSFLLDLDLFVAAPQPFLAPALLAQFTELHEEIDRFFRWTLTSDGELRFGLEELS
jgi:uncharacterized protein (TIGR04255 family)